MPKKILWLSQHKPLPMQIERLQKRYGNDVHVDHDDRTFANAEELTQRFRTGNFDDWVVVAPLSVIGHLCGVAERLDLPKPLYAQMESLPPARRAEADFSFRGRHYKFLKFSRVKRLALDFEEGEDF